MRVDVQVTVSENPSIPLLREWDRLVDHTPGTDVTQLSTWAELRGRVGFRPVYLLATSGTELVGGAQVLVRTAPLVGATGYLPYGPVLAAEHSSVGEARSVLSDALASFGRQGVRMLFIQPTEGDHASTDELQRRGFWPSAAGIAPAGSIRIDLRADLADIRARFGPRLRSWTNRWESRGVKVRPGDARDIPLLIDLMAATARHHGYPAMAADYVEALYVTLAADGHAVLFVGEVDGVPVAADIMTVCGDMVRGRLSGFDRTGPGAQLSVPAAIRWEMIQWAKAAGYRWFDFGGLHAQTLDALLCDPVPNVDTLPAADQPKLTFGGTAFRYPQAVEMIRPALLRAAYLQTVRSRAGKRLQARAQDRMRGVGAGLRRP